MTRWLVAVAMLMISSGIAYAEEKVIDPEIGEVTKSTAEILDIVRARRYPRGYVAVEQTSVKPQESAPIVSATAQQPISAKSAAMQAKWETVTTVAEQSATTEKTVVRMTLEEIEKANENRYPYSLPIGKTWDDFSEFSAYAGGWYALDAHTRGLWGQAEYTKWYTKRKAPENFGFGPTVKGDYGEGPLGDPWGYVALGANLDWYYRRTMDDGFLLKFRPLYRWNKGDKPDGFMPGVYADYFYKIAPRQRLVFSGEFNYFHNDSYGALTAQWEYAVARGVRVRAGLGTSVNIFKNNTFWGWGPNAQVRFYDRFVIGANLNFIHGGPFLGAYVGYELNSDLERLRRFIGEKSVKELSNDELAKNVELSLSTETIDEIEKKGGKR